MAAFKAANPGAVLEDFRCWYSLRDQVDSDKFPEGDTHIYRDASVAIQAGSAKNGVAQECMSEIDKVRIWESVDACAARDQKPLFDHIREAEKVCYQSDILSRAPVTAISSVSLIQKHVQYTDWQVPVHGRPGCLSCLILHNYTLCALIN